MNEAQYRRRGGLVVVSVGVVLAALLGLFLWNPVIDKGTPVNLPDYAEFNGSLQQSGGSFYDAPNPLPERIPGSVLKSEPLKDAPPGVLATRFVYMSQTADGKHQAVSGLFAVRSGPPPDPNGRPLVAVAHGTTGNAPGCGISQAPFTIHSTGYSTYKNLIEPLLTAGYATVTTDYANLGVPGVQDYLVKKGEAHDVLNSIRAAFSMAPDYLDSTKVAVLGHSQGGHASLSAAELAPTYAPDISLKGAVALAPALFPPAPLLLTFIENGPGGDTSYFLAFVSGAVVSWSKNWPDKVSESDVFTPKGVEAAQVGNVKCLGVLHDSFKGPITDYVKRDISTKLLPVAADNFPVYQRYQMPVLMQQGMKDTTVVPGINVAAAKTYCKQGTTIVLQEYPNDVHSSVLWSARPAFLDWLNNRFDGKPAPSMCGGR